LLFAHRVFADKTGIWMDQADTMSNTYRFAEAGPCFALSLSTESSTLSALCQKGIVTAEFTDEQYKFQNLPVSDSHQQDS
jgi:hypothetical protein